MRRANWKRRLARARGGAAVETAVLMVLLVPLILYTLFLEDLLFYKFDQQETVTSSPWDLTAIDYRHTASASDMVGNVQRLDRLTYADHSSAHNAYDDITQDTDDERHHQALAAHQCWLAEGGKQVTFSLDSSVGKPGSDFDSVSGGPSGGLAKTQAILGVQNYILLNQFLQDGYWSKVDVTKQKRWNDTNFHDNAKQDPYLFPEDFQALLVDSYALNYNRSSGGGGDFATSQQEVTPTAGLSTTEFASWVNAPYMKQQSKLNKATQFASDAIDKKILASQVKVDGVGDMLDTLTMNWKVNPNDSEGDFKPSGMRDQRVSDTYSARGAGYMGAQQ